MIPHEPIPYVVIIASPNLVNNTDFGKCQLYKSLTVVNPRMEFVVSKIIQKETIMEIEDEFSNEVPQNNEKINPEDARIMISVVVLIDLNLCQRRKTRLRRGVSDKFSFYLKSRESEIVCSLKYASLL